MAEMKRLTYLVMKGSENDGWYLKPGVSRERALGRLAEYENIGITPEELKSLIPVPIGTPVYYIVNCGCHPSYAQRCQERQANNDKRIKAVAIHCLGKARTRINCVKIHERPFSIDCVGKLGKTVFLTMEDAVTSLRKDGDGNG